MTPPRASRTQDALAAVRHAPGLLAGLERIERLVAAVRHDGVDAVPLLREAAADPQDQLTAVAAVHAAAAGGACTASGVVLPLLGSPVPFLREHAAWSLRRAPRLEDAVAPLTAIARQGGFTGMLAEVTLEAWDPATPEGQGPAPASAATSGASRGPSGPARGAGLTVAQLFLHADIDGTLTHAGRGDTGGIATLLVHLGDALLADPRVARVLTLSRAHHEQERAPDDPHAPGHHYLGVPLPGPPRPAAATWPLRGAVRSGLRRVLTEVGTVDVLHLRMADVGSWVAADVAGDLGIPTVLTLAPDPHALITAREAAGSLTRAGFGSADHAEHLVFRVQLLRDLAARAAALVVFPRADLERDLRELLHLDPGTDTRLRIVPEGIDLAPLDRAGLEVRAAAEGTPPSAPVRGDLEALDTLLQTLPPARRSLPLVVTVGRLHRVKGMATLVEAWAGDPACRERCNLLVVGGDLEDPTDDEAEELALVDAVLAREGAAAQGMLLAGHRPNSVVATWLAAVRHGRPGLSAPGGAYVSASLKEEFGIAILEAMASGLVVVAPREGGPATYVEPGVTGLLVDTTSRSALAAAVTAALDLASAPGADARAEEARTLVAERFGIATMAASLADLYEEVSGDAAGHQS